MDFNKLCSSYLIKLAVQVSVRVFAEVSNEVKIWKI